MKKATISVLSTLAGVAIGAETVGTMRDKEIQKWKDSSSRNLYLFKMMCQWVKVKQEGKNLADYLEKMGYKRIAIYGMSYAGETLLGELDGTKVQAVYGIDRDAEWIHTRIEVVSMDEPLDEVDAVVVTAVTYFDEIKKNLSEKMDCPIISLEDILYEV